MYLSGRHELFVLFGTFLGGVILGFVFDLFRIFRKNFKGASSFVWVQDILLWAVMLFVVYTVVFITDDGNIRWYQFLGFGTGAVIYMLLLSSFVVKISSAVISFLKMVFKWAFAVFSFPFKLLEKFLITPVLTLLKRWAKSISRLFRNQKRNFFRSLRIFKKI